MKVCTVLSMFLSCQYSACKCYGEFCIKGRRFEKILEWESAELVRLSEGSVVPERMIATDFFFNCTVHPAITEVFYYQAMHKRTVLKGVLKFT